MIPSPDQLGAWVPAGAADRAMARRVAKPRKGDLVGGPGYYEVGHLVTLCASRGVTVLFRTADRAPPARRLY